MSLFLAKQTDEFSHVRYFFQVLHGFDNLFYLLCCQGPDGVLSAIAEFFPEVLFLNRVFRMFVSEGHLFQIFFAIFQHDFHRAHLYPFPLILLLEPGFYLLRYRESLLVLSPLGRKVLQKHVVPIQRDPQDKRQAELGIGAGFWPSFSVHVLIIAPPETIAQNDNLCYLFVKKKISL